MPRHPAPSGPSPAGVLFVVATPIGNLDDLSPRSARVLTDVDVIAAEDTRTSRKLVPSRRAPPRWISLHEHNETRAADHLIGLLEAGASVALVSDAGTPLVSDPGYRLVAEAHARGIRVSPVPGPCAAIAALSAAGLAPDRFTFEGFLPVRASARRQRLGELRARRETLIFYVPARDLPDVLAEAAEAFGAERTATVARELTKQFETIRRGALAELAGWCAGDPDQQRGEAVLLVAGNPDQASPAVDVDALARELAAELPPARAARVLARVAPVDRREAFAKIESIRNRQG
ncbi:MAG: 16S rRNA (cytidine(1402)-2'-O)-methyltransferase [Wenzhouxiangellaceae bacterium]|nr:16S rRNA (cytidine(1402)-2'-O)-methyltransferase [Wenzhouxiangellaceae bacterium]